MVEALAKLPFREIYAYRQATFRLVPFDVLGPATKLSTDVIVKGSGRSLLVDIALRLHLTF